MYVIEPLRVYYGITYHIIVCIWCGTFSHVLIKLYFRKNCVKRIKFIYYILNIYIKTTFNTETWCTQCYNIIQYYYVLSLKLNNNEGLYCSFSWQRLLDYDYYYSKRYTIPAIHYWMASIIRTTVYPLSLM